MYLTISISRIANIRVPALEAIFNKVSPADYEFKYDTNIMVCSMLLTKSHYPVV